MPLDFNPYPMPILDGLGFPIKVGPFNQLVTGEEHPTVQWKAGHPVLDTVNDFNVTTPVGSGSVSVAGGHLIVSTGTTAGSSARVETIDPMIYRTGQGSACRFTFPMIPPTANGTIKVGPHITTDGFAVGFQGTTLGLWHINNSTTTFIPQSSWNGDKLDGSGPSGANCAPGSPCRKTCGRETRPR